MTLYTHYYTIINILFFFYIQGVHSHSGSPKKNPSDWKYEGIIIAEYWHLSFPFVVECRGVFYMTTSATAGMQAPALFLYEAAHPLGPWKRRTAPIDLTFNVKGVGGFMVDPVVLWMEKQHTWYIWYYDASKNIERLFFGDTLTGKVVFESSKIMQK